MALAGNPVGRLPARHAGVTIFGVASDRIAWGRLYLEQVEAGSQPIDEAVRHMAEGAPPA